MDPRSVNSLSSHTTMGGGASSSAASTGSAVFPGVQNYTTLYNFQSSDNEPVNLSNNNSGSTYNMHQQSSTLHAPGTFSAMHSPSPHSLQIKEGHKFPSHTARPLPKLQQGAQAKRKKTSYPPLLPFPPALKQQTPLLHQQDSSVTQQQHPSHHQPPPLHSASVQQLGSSTEAVLSKSTSLSSHSMSSSPAIQAALNQPVIGRERAHKHSEIGSKGGHAIASKTPIPTFHQAPTMMHYLSQPPIQIVPKGKASNKPHKPRKRSQNKPERVKSNNKFKKIKSASFQLKEDRFIMASQISGTPLTATYTQSGLPAMSDQFAPVSSPRSAMMLSQSGSAENSLLTSEASNDAFKEMSGHFTTSTVDDEKFAPVDLRRNGEEEFSPVQMINDLPPGPKSVLEMRLYKKQKRMFEATPTFQEPRIDQLTSGTNFNTLAQDIEHYNRIYKTTAEHTKSRLLPSSNAQSTHHITNPQSTHHINSSQFPQPSPFNSSWSTQPSFSKAANSSRLQSGAIAGQSSHSSATQLNLGAITAHTHTKSALLRSNAIPAFRWTSYLKQVQRQALPHSAFKHVEASLLNGFMVGMKVETPLRGVDTDKYWLATIVAVYGPILKLRFDGYGDRSKDFTMLCSSGNLHPIGWCAKTHKSLLPPADIRHTQKQWKNFLMNALQGAKTVPSYLLSTRGGPWIADRIRQGMRLEVLHEKLPTAVWVAKVIRNVGGRMKLRYEGSIDDATDFWLFYLDRRVRPCGWAVEPHNAQAMIYRPPDEIRATYEYEAWSEILTKVTRDQSIERIPAEIIRVPSQRQPMPHTFRVGQVLETVHPSGSYISPAKVISVIAGSDYITVEMIECDPPTYTSGVLDSEIPPVTKCCHILDLTLLPVGWCREHGLRLSRSEVQSSTTSSKPDFDWTIYMKQTNSQAATDPNLLNQRVPVHQFSVDRCLEAVNPANTDQICVATIKRITGRLLWLDIYTTQTTSTTIITDVSSQSIFPAGWCESNNYPLTSPVIDIPKPTTELASTSNQSQATGNVVPTLYFNHSCFTGPFLSKRRLVDLPAEISGRTRVRSMVKEMLNLLISVGYRSSYILKTLQRTEAPNRNMHPQLIKTMCNGKSYEGVIEVCTKQEELTDYCRKICKRLKCCPNLVSTQKVKEKCSENCHTLTKTQFLCVQARKPGRPSSTNPDGSKKKKRKKRKKVFTPRRNLYIPRYEYPNGASENGSASSNSMDEDVSPTVEERSLPGFTDTLSPMKSVRHSPVLPSTSRPEEEVVPDIDTQNPLYQLRLQFVKKTPGTTPPTPTSAPPPSVHKHPGELEESHQYQIVKSKKRRGRPPKQQQSPEEGHNSSQAASSNKRYPTVPPLKIRRLDMSPTPTTLTSTELAPTTSTNGSIKKVSPTLQGNRAFTPSTPSTSATKSHKPISIKTELRKIFPAPIKTESNADTKSDLLLKPTAPHPVARSALSFERKRLRVPVEDLVVLEDTDNPYYWEPQKVQEYLEKTDCANVAEKIGEQGVNGEAFMLLNIPTIQDEFQMKLGPAIKLVYHVQRLQLAYYEKFQPGCTPLDI